MRRHGQRAPALPPAAPPKKNTCSIIGPCCRCGCLQETGGSLGWSALAACASLTRSESSPHSRRSPRGPAKRATDDNGKRHQRDMQACREAAAGGRRQGVPQRQAGKQAAWLQNCTSAWAMADRRLGVESCARLHLKSLLQRGQELVAAADLDACARPAGKSSQSAHRSGSSGPRTRCGAGVVGRPILA